MVCMFQASFTAPLSRAWEPELKHHPDARPACVVDAHNQRLASRVRRQRLADDVGHRDGIATKLLRSKQVSS